MKKAASNQLKDVLTTVCFDIYVSNSWKLHRKEFLSVVTKFKPAMLLTANSDNGIY